MTLQQLLRDRLTVLKLRPADLRRQLVKAGTPVTKQAVNHWLNGGGGIADKHKPAVATALGVSVKELVYAAAGIPLESTEQFAEAA